MTTFILPDGDYNQLIRLDVDETVSTDYESAATELAVEEGEPIADHIRKAVKRISISGVVSNTPLFSNPRGAEGTFAPLPLSVQYYQPPIPISPGGLINAGIDAVGDALGLGDTPPTEHLGLTYPEEFNAGADLEEQLNQFRDQRQICEVITRTRRHPNMVLESFTINETQRTGAGGSEITISLKSIRIAKVQTTVAPVLPEEPRGVPLSTQGVKNVKTPEEAQESLTKESVLYTVSELGKNFIANGGLSGLGL